MPGGVDANTLFANGKAVGRNSQKTSLLSETFITLCIPFVYNPPNYNAKFFKGELRPFAPLFLRHPSLSIVVPRPSHKKRMPPKGSKIPNRKPQVNHTRSDSSLKVYVQQQLILDIESFGPGVPISRIAATRDIYGHPKTDPKRYIAIKNKFDRLKLLKVDDPEEYWYVGCAA